MKVLVACEESQEVCKAFRERGHEAYSADLQDCSGGHPEWHIMGDVLPLLNGNCSFITRGGCLGEHRRKMGSDHRASAMHTPGSKRGQMVPGKAEGFQTAESVRAVHADDAGKRGKGSG